MTLLFGAGEDQIGQRKKNEKGKNSLIALKPTKLLNSSTYKHPSTINSALFILLLLLFADNVFILNHNR